jgi:integrase
VTPTKSPSTPTISGEGKHQSVLSYSPTAKAEHKQNVKTLLQIEQVNRERGIINPQPNPQALLRIEKLVLYIEGKGRGKSTQTAYTKNLYYLAQRTTELNDTVQVELAIARYIKKDGHPATNNYKSKLCDCYARYCKFYKIFWEKPIYTPEEHSIQPPTDERCSMLIAAAKGKLSLKIDVSTQTGLRPIEVVGEKGLRVNDIHFDQNTITSRSTKGCNARPPMKIQDELAARLKTHIIKNQLQPNDILFTGLPKSYGESYRRFRNRLSKKLNDPTIASIRLYDLRHHYVTKQLKRCQNAEIVRQIVGHKRLNTTQKYMHLLAGTSGEWIVEGALDKERAKELLANDFSYQLTTPDGTMLFKKAK